MSQGSFGFYADPGRSYRQLVRAVEDAIAVLGLDVAAGATGVGKSDLLAMISGRNGRRLPTDVAAVVADRVGVGAYRDAITAAVRELFGLVQPESDAEYAHRLERTLLRFGEPGADALAQARREARR